MAGCTFTMASRPVKTVSEIPDNSSLMVGVVAASFVSVLCIVVVVLALYFRNKILHLIGCTHARNKQTDHEMSAIKTTRPIPLASFLQHVELMHRDSNLLFSEEYKNLVELSPKEPSEAAENPACRGKNRYTNVLPFDHARVKLLPMEDDEASDYINASFIPGYKGPREYIAAQGPLEATKEDFWRMVWEKHVTAIVMLTQCTERGKVKCEEYWPPEQGSSVYFGDLVVTMRSVSVLPDYVIRVMDLDLGSHKRTIHQFHFLKWPDFGCPDKTFLLLNLVAAVRSHTPHNPNSPMVVHCSAGVGRTGTFIALDVLLQQIRNPEATTVDIFGLVLAMRMNRPLMVQRENQYIYIFDCLRDAMLDESEDEASTPPEDEHVYQNC